MQSARVDDLVRSAEPLSGDEKLELAQRLIERVLNPGQKKAPIDLNSLAGVLRLEEDPLEIQLRMRRDWD